MSTILERLDKLKALIQEDDFLEGRGLSNEVNIRIFCYDPKDEMAVQHFTKQLITDQNLKCNIIECNLYKIMMELINDMDIMDEIIENEESYESDRQGFISDIASATGTDGYIEKICEKEPGKNDIVLITGVGDAFPFMRVHNILNAIQPTGFESPILVLYPGTYDGRHLTLFDRLVSNDYYRAFNVL